MSSNPAFWTDADQQECLRLLYKARGCSILPALMKQVMEVEKGWDYIPADAKPGAMSDASKRQRESEPPASFAVCGGAFPDPMPSAATAATTLVSMAKLPPGVKNVAEWGRNMVSFGKFMGK